MDAEGGAVAVTADHEPVDPVHAVLRTRLASVAGAHVLDEQKLAAGPQHPAQLPQRPRLVVHPAQHQRRDRHVEGGVLERQVLRWCAQHRCTRRLLTDLALQAAQHRGLGLGQGQRLDGRAVEAQVRPRPGADLKHPAGRAGEQPFPVGAQPCLLHLGHLTVIRHGEEPAPQRHDCLISSQ